MGSTGYITYCTVHNVTGHHRATGLPAKDTAEVPAQRQDSARTECHHLGFGIHTDSDTSVWYCAPHRKSTGVCEPRSGGRSDPTCHYSRWPSGGLCAFHPFNFGLCLIRMSQRGHTLATPTPFRGYSNTPLGLSVLPVSWVQQANRVATILQRDCSYSARGGKDALTWWQGVGPGRNIHETQMICLGTSWYSLVQRRLRIDECVNLSLEGNSYQGLDSSGIRV